MNTIIKSAQLLSEEGTQVTKDILIKDYGVGMTVFSKM